MGEREALYCAEGKECLFLRRYPGSTARHSDKTIMKVETLKWLEAVA
jgi:hypothetical protein